MRPRRQWDEPPRELRCFCGERASIRLTFIERRADGGQTGPLDHCDTHAFAEIERALGYEGVEVRAERIAP